MALQEQLTYMYALERFGIKPGLEVMHQMMELLGHPEQTFKSVHIAGTNGKGSTAAFIDSILRNTELTVGLYTSPHIYTFNERIQINGKAISDEELASLIQELKEVTEKNGLQPTFFEFTTALAYMHFAKKKVDIAVVEVGMGGLLDATNVIIPLVAVITNIGLDHMEFLGDTKEKIAKEKAGVIKQGVPLVTSEKDPRIQQLLKKTCEQNNAPYYHTDDVFQMSLVSESLDNQRFKVEGAYEGTLSIHLLGHHQLQNAACALGAILELKKAGLEISNEAIEQGMANARWEGRLDVVSTKPLILVDGAHNQDGVHVLHDYIKNLPRHDVLVVAQKKGKDITDMATHIVPMFTNIIVTQGNFMPEDPSVIAEKLIEHHSSIQAIADIGEALAEAKKHLPPDGTMLITGSLYMVADALAVLRHPH